MMKSTDFQRTGRELLEKLRAMYAEAAKELRLLKKEYRLCPRGELYIRKNRSGWQYYEKLKNEEHPITGNREKILRLMRKRVIEYEMRCREIFCSSIAEITEKIAGELMNEERKSYARTLKRIYEIGNVPTIVPDRDAEAWRKEEYVTNPYMPEKRIYMTACGIMVRSKSEKIIADRLYAFGIDFRYEAQLVLAGDLVYPDFTIRTKSGQIIIWEHLGMLDDEGYMQSTIMKLERYRQAGFKQHTNLICTDEEDIKSVQIIDDIIKKHLL